MSTASDCACAVGARTRARARARRRGRIAAKIFAVGARQPALGTLGDMGKGLRRDRRALARLASRKQPRLLRRAASALIRARAPRSSRRTARSSRSAVIGPHAVAYLDVHRRPPRDNRPSARARARRRHVLRVRGAAADPAPAGRGAVRACQTTALNDARAAQFETRRRESRPAIVPASHVSSRGRLVRLRRAANEPPRARWEHYDKFPARRLRRAQGAAGVCSSTSGKNAESDRRPAGR